MVVCYNDEDAQILESLNLFSGDSFSVSFTRKVETKKVSLYWVQILNMFIVGPVFNMPY